jgi:homeobox protein cut-like
LSVVCAQRDRFKARMVQLDHDNASLQRRFEKQAATVASLEAHNLELFKKIRYLESFGSSSSSSPLSSSSPSALSKRTSDLYEQSMNPFAEFAQREKAERFRDLSIAEKFAFYIGQFLTANRFTRSFIFFYSLFLHLLVVATIYRMAFASSLH